MGNGSKKEVIREFKGGEVIFREKTEGNEMYIIKSGKVQISRYVGEKKIILDVLGENEFFGEMALLAGKERTATATALKGSVLITITKDMLDRQLTGVPTWFIVMLKTLVRRLEKADARINQ